jgi:hypothetical protein
MARRHGAAVRIGHGGSTPGFEQLATNDFADLARDATG